MFNLKTPLKTHFVKHVNAFFRRQAKAKLPSRGSEASLWRGIRRNAPSRFSNQVSRRPIKYSLVAQLIVFVWLSPFVVLGQGVGINPAGAEPHPSAGLDVNFTNKGLLPPRLTAEQRDAIEDPATGLQIFNLTTNCLEIFIPPDWQNIFCGCSAAPSNLIYSDSGPLLYCVNSVISPNNASTQSSTPGSFTVSPGLPAGLSLNYTTGQITGAPLMAAASAEYTVTAANACGSTSQVLDITISGVPAVPESISGPSAPTVGTSAGYSIPAVSMAASYTWTVPAGWTIDSGQGSTAISVTVGNNSGNVGVSATNACGTSVPAIKATTPWRPVAATGGTITTYTADGSNGQSGVQYRVHLFTTTGSSSFQVIDAGDEGQVDYLIAAGGGGGGGGTGGGGGAGGVLSGTMPVSNGLLSVLVGAGGSGGSCSVGQNGGNSSFNNLIASGGGRGGQNAFSGCIAPQPPGSGGSGGGGSEGNAGASGTLGQGNSGGTATNWNLPNYGAGGGGGAGAPGGNGNSTSAGNGGAGMQSTITGSTLFYGGGGGGGTFSGGVLGLGGAGGGGSAPAGNGQPNTGGGGGGQINNSTAAAGSGGSGTVIIRYPITNPNQ